MALAGDSVGWENDSVQLKSFLATLVPELPSGSIQAQEAGTQPAFLGGSLGGSGTNLGSLEWLLCVLCGFSGPAVSKVSQLFMYEVRSRILTLTSWDCF